MKNLILFLFKYFWFAGIFIAIINFLINKYNWNKNYDENNKNDSKLVSKGLKYYLILGVLLPTFLGVLQLLGGYSNAFYIFYSDYNNAYLYLFQS